jgi:hypothetical protein
MDVNDNAFFPNQRVALKSIASKLAPTAGRRLRQLLQVLAKENPDCWGDQSGFVFLL